MKLFSTISGILLGLALCACIGYSFYMYGIPYLDAQSEYTKNIPSIEKLTTERDILNSRIDSLTRVTNEQFILINGQTSVIQLMETQINQYSKTSSKNADIINKLQLMQQQLENLSITDTTENE